MHLLYPTKIHKIWETLNISIQKVNEGIQKTLPKLGKIRVQAARRRRHHLKVQLLLLLCHQFE